MARTQRLNPADAHTLKSALTDFRCYSYADVVAATGWSMNKVTRALMAQRLHASRDPAGAGWTVAPLPKGWRRAADGSREAYHFVVVDARTGEALSEQDRQSIVRGGVQTLGLVDAQMTNFATTIRLTAAQLGGRSGEQATDIADILIGASKMTTGAHRRLSGKLVAG